MVQQGPCRRGRLLPRTSAEARLNCWSECSKRLGLPSIRSRFADVGRTTTFQRCIISGPLMLQDDNIDETRRVVSTEFGRVDSPE